MTMAKAAAAKKSKGVSKKDAYKVEGDKVVVSSPRVEKPAAVRYAWKTVPDCNLANARGLPASPFRTDDWPVPDAPLPAKEKKP